VFRNTAGNISFIFLKSKMPQVVRLMYESGCAFSPRTNFMW